MVGIHFWELEILMTVLQYILCVILKSYSKHVYVLIKTELQNL